MKKNSKIPAHMDRIGKAWDKLDGNVGDQRHDSVEAHLGAIASNLEAEVADRGEAAKAAQALAVEAKRKADEFQKLADEAKAAADPTADDKNSNPQKSKTGE